MRIIFLMSMAAVGLSVSGLAIAQASHPCASIREASDRLACYDRAFPPAGNAETLKSTAERQADAQRDFGLTAWQRGDRTAEPGVRNVERKIKHVERIETGQRIVTMDGDETWLLTESGNAGQLNDGDAVEIRKATFGTYMLITPRKVALRARRIH